jgi:curved DNA-binding protein
VVRNVTTSVENLRLRPRRSAECTVELTWKSEAGEKLFNTCRAINVSDSGVGIECPEAIPSGSNVVLWAVDFQVAALASVRHCTWRRSIYVIGLHFLAKTSLASTASESPDHYEILRLSPQADQETIEQVYRTLAKRYHPDNQDTGDPEAFLRISDAYRVLSNPSRRHRYDEDRSTPRPLTRALTHSREIGAGIQGVQKRRMEVLGILYLRASQNPESPAIGLLDLEQLIGCGPQELGFALWYLCERSLVRVADGVQYRITASGIDVFEEKMVQTPPPGRELLT